MKAKIEREISKLKMKITIESERLDGMVEELRDSVRKYDAYNIVTFVPGMINGINDYRQQLTILNEQLQLLVWLIDEEE